MEQGFAENLQRYALQIISRSPICWWRKLENRFSPFICFPIDPQRERVSGARIIYSEVKFSRNRANRITHKISDWLFHLHPELEFSFFSQTNTLFCLFSLSGSRQQRDSSACFVTVALSSCRVGGIRTTALRAYVEHRKLLHDRQPLEIYVHYRESLSSSGKLKFKAFHAINFNGNSFSSFNRNKIFEVNWRVGRLEARKVESWMVFLKTLFRSAFRLYWENYKWTSVSCIGSLMAIKSIFLGALLFARPPQFRTRTRLSKVFRSEQETELIANESIHNQWRLLLFREAFRFSSQLSISTMLLDTIDFPSRSHALRALTRCVCN